MRAQARRRTRAEVWLRSTSRRAREPSLRAWSPRERRIRDPPGGAPARQVLRELEDLCEVAAAFRAELAAPGDNPQVGVEAACAQDASERRVRRLPGAGLVLNDRGGR